MMKVLIVCMGNICRSPIAHGVVRERLRRHGLAQRVEVDSAGTHDYHQGSPPDERAIAAASRRGIDISDLRARRVEREDFEAFDLLLAMDAENIQALHAMAEVHQREKIHLFMEYAAGERGRIVPDPYYGGPVGFERVLDMAEEAAEHLLQRWLVQMTR